jgi:hypothetical protein
LLAIQEWVSGEYVSSSSNDESSKPPAPPKPSLLAKSSPTCTMAIGKKSKISDESSSLKENLLDLLRERERLLIKEII